MMKTCPKCKTKYVHLCDCPLISLNKVFTESMESLDETTKSALRSVRIL